MLLHDVRDIQDVIIVGVRDEDRFNIFCRRHLPVDEFCIHFNFLESNFPDRLLGKEGGEEECVLVERNNESGYAEPLDANGTFEVGVFGRERFRAFLKTDDISVFDPGRLCTPQEEEEQEKGKGTFHGRLCSPLSGIRASYSSEESLTNDRFLDNLNRIVYLNYMAIFLVLLLR